MIINIFLITVIIAGTAGIVFCLKADKKNQNRKKPKSGSNYMSIASVLLVIITASAVVVLVRAMIAAD
ncbi:MAG: hypothetical protein WCP55_19785, partial [Lentisphaerota bacterium]